MATSLMNDSYYLNEITSKLLYVAERIYNNDITKELTKLKKKKKIQYWFEDPFGVSEKKLDKALIKLSNRRSNLKQKVKNIKNNEEKRAIHEEIEILELTQLKYRR